MTSMELQINCMQSLYRKMEMSQRKNKGYFSIMSNETETSLNSPAQEKVQRGFSIHDAYSIMKSSGTKFSVGNLATVSENLDKRVDTERYSIESTSEIAAPCFRRKFLCALLHKLLDLPDLQGIL